MLAPNIAREITLMPLFPKNASSRGAVSRACAGRRTRRSPDAAVDQIVLGQADIAIAGGAESLSNVPESAALARRVRTRSSRRARRSQLGQRLGAFARSSVRAILFTEITPAIAEPTTGETMGVSAEKMAKLNHIARGAQDETRSLASPT